MYLLVFHKIVLITKEKKEKFFLNITTRHEKNLYINAIMINFTYAFYIVNIHKIE